MPTYQVSFEQIITYGVDIEAEDKEDAESQIEALVKGGTLKEQDILHEDWIKVLNIEQIEEPIEPESSPPPASPASSRKRTATKSATPRAR
jgi:hypothetical protein